MLSAVLALVKGVQIELIKERYERKDRRRIKIRCKQILAAIWFMSN